MKKVLQNNIFRCLRCGYIWPIGKVKNPRQCAKCNNTKWNIPREKFNTGKENGMWRGDKVGKIALHDYIKYHIPLPDKCDNCHKMKKLDLANISQEYKRDLSDWEWLCRSCHMIKDGRLERLQLARRKWNEERKLKGAN